MKIVFDDMCRIGHWLFRSSFDADILHFRSR